MKHPTPGDGAAPTDRAALATAYAERGGLWATGKQYAEAAQALAALYAEITEVDRALDVVPEDAEPIVGLVDSPDVDRALTLWERREVLLRGLTPAIAKAHVFARQMAVPLNLFGKLCDAPDCRDLLYPGQPLMRLATPGFMILDFHPLCAANTTGLTVEQLLADGGLRR